MSDIPSTDAEVESSEHSDAQSVEATDGASTDSAIDSDAPVGNEAPETGDLVIDAALRELAAAPQDDLDAQIERGEQVQRTLQGRLSDLGG